ncbi:sulfiredoxin [Fragilariopsis cylindrus CCMP1102]|uniref:Sulfiredoxin n=1 Tax=Fragilariopsis cylindrus CCMP1102 TaxID=635003 RepID=A0A1E7F9I7_9STRA|nr:sulfiredoxin [Fragilariopsis cylindrus CCMP1102]|eukprot:OEU14799.1 sulfiredoxin [Fragilariopsis cylindrus CCMP1102]
MIRTGGEQGGLLGVKGLKQLQLLLGTDLSDLCDGTTFPKSAKGVAKIKAQIGQPVVLGGGAQHGVVRLAIGATDICEAVEMAMQIVTTREDDKDDPFATLDALSDAIDAMVIHDTKLLRKIELLATHWDAVAKRFDELPATAVRWQARLAAEGVVGPAASDNQKPQEVTNVDIGWLKPHEMVVNQDRVNALVDAIGRWGAYRKPLLVDKDSGSILDGHHRYFAALELGLEKVPAALVDYLEDDSISVELWPGDHGVATISKQDVIDMCLSPNVFPPKTSRHTFAEPLSPIFVPLEELNDNDD